MTHPNIAMAGLKSNDFVKTPTGITVKATKAAPYIIFNASSDIP